MKTLNQLVSIALIITVSALSSFAGEALKVNSEKSTVKWTGYHLAKSYEHWGNVKVKSGSVTMEGDNIANGMIVLDMSSISNGDLEGAKNKKLVNHLKSDDFFNVEKFPESSLTIKSSTMNGDKYTIKADLKIRGISKEISFDAIKKGDNTFNSSFTIDRTIHEVMYGWSVENAMLDNDIKFDISLVLN
jgi:polyisoprenoid-binding protein YceI